MMRLLKKSFYTLLTVGLLLLLAWPVLASEGDIPKADKEMRGVWVSSVLNLDYPAKPTLDPAILKQEATTILDNVSKMGFNAVFLQVRPGGDSLYPSQYYPWSKYLTGSQGIAPANGFDPLAYWVQEAHKRGIALHAWINPYRVTKQGEAEYLTLSAASPAKLHPEWLIKHTDGNYYFDPALPEVRDFVVAGAVEIVSNYDVDGIHLDDYFYPGIAFPDEASFAKYGTGFASKEDWRRENVNLLIQQLDHALHQAKPAISFGVSPAGIWENQSSNPLGSATKGGNPSYSKLFADSRTWAKEGWVDYLAPQIYWEIGHPQADYQTVATWWADALKGSDTKLYIGLASYKSAGAAADSVWCGPSEIGRQLLLDDAMPQIQGEIFFRYGLLDDVPGLPELIQDYYSGKEINHLLTSNLPQTNFTDLAGAKWAEPYITRLTAKGIVNGVGQGKFAPQAQVKRSEFVKMLLLTFERPLEGNLSCSYQDVLPTAWYAPYLAASARDGITPAGSGSFYPEQNISREDMAIFAGNALQAAGIILPAVPRTDTPFTDDGNLTAQGRQAVYPLVAAGVLNGYEDGSFRPQGQATRAEATKVICTLLDLYQPRGN